MSKLVNHLIHAPSFTARPRVGVGFECVCQKSNEKVTNEFDFLPNELYKLFYKRSNNMQDQETAVADQNTTDEFAITEALSVRESRLAVVLFELLKPQLEKMIDAKLDGFKESEINDSSSFDINDYTGDIEDIVGDWVRYNVTITSTID